MRLQFSVALLFCAAASAAVPSIEESLGMKSVTGAQISPDGRYVAYTVQQANWEENDFYTQLWVAVPATGERYQPPAARNLPAVRSGRPIRAASPSPATATASASST